MVEETPYINWDLEQPGISFSAKYGRISILKKTLEILGYPEYYRFLFSPEDRLFAVQACKISDEGAHRLPVETIEENYEIKSMDLVQFIFDVCGWNKKVSYRAAGMEIAEENTIQFDLSTALEISAGRFIKR